MLQPQRSSGKSKCVTQMRIQISTFVLGLSSVTRSAVNWAIDGR